MPGQIKTLLVGSHAPSEAVKETETTGHRPPLVSTGTNREDHLLYLTPSLGASMAGQSGPPLWTLPGTFSKPELLSFQIKRLFPTALVCWSVQYWKGRSRAGLTAQCLRLWNSPPGDTIHPNPSSQLLRAHLVNEIIQYANWGLWIQSCREKLTPYG